MKWAEFPQNMMSAMATAAVLLCPGWAAADTATGDPARGKDLYQSCTGCHSLDENDISPRHRGVVGRPSASLADYAYSAALKASHLTWDQATLDRWLSNPSALVPGTKMYFKIDDPQMRADIIAYLSQVK